MLVGSYFPVKPRSSLPRRLVLIFLRPFPILIFLRSSSTVSPPERSPRGFGVDDSSSYCVLLDSFETRLYSSIVWPPNNLEPVVYGALRGKIKAIMARVPVDATEHPILYHPIGLLTNYTCTPLVSLRFFSSRLFGARAPFSFRELCRRRGVAGRRVQAKESLAHPYGTVWFSPIPEEEVSLHARRGRPTLVKVRCHEPAIDHFFFIPPLGYMADVE